MQRVAFALLLGFTLVAFVCLIYLGGRGNNSSYYDGRPIEPIDTFGNWVREGSGPVPAYLKLWIAAILGWCVAMTGIVIHHGFRY